MSSAVGPSQQRNAVNGAVPAGIARALDLLDSSPGLRVGVLVNRLVDDLEPVFASQDAAEGAAAFRGRRDPVWQDR
jgi:hypothetical protein